MKKRTEYCIGMLSWLLLAAVLMARAGQEEKPVQQKKLEEYVLVTASLAPTIKSEAGRSVLVITSEEIKNLPVSTVEELLKYVCGFDFQQRGAGGIQVDPSVRSGTFEQTLILLNGFKLTDPQTGHNTLNIPVSLEDIERVEILKGPGSRIFGPNALSGAVNIITRSSATGRFSLAFRRGQYGYQELTTGLKAGGGACHNTLSFSIRSSDGYMENTDFSHLILHDSLSVNFSSARALFQAGFSEKAFGANGFYSPSFPEQWEKTRVLFLAGDTFIYGKHSTVNPRVYLRLGSDEFLLKRSNPSFYRNLHHNLSGGAEIKFYHYSRLGQTTAGLEIRTERIDSNRLGVHERTTSGLFVEHKVQSSGFVLLAGGVLYHYPSHGWKFWPGAEVNYNLRDALKLFVSYNQAFRLPTFTELFYADPVNLGNPELQPEKTRELEAGFRHEGKIVGLEAGIFFRKADNLIDWVKSSSSEPWRAENISKIITRGVESKISLGRDLLHRFPWLETVSTSFVYYHNRKYLEGYLSKYALSGLRTQLLFGLQFKPVSGWRMSLNGRYFQRLTGNKAFVLDGRLSRSYRNLEFFVEATNLGNSHYYDAGFLPAPGRWLYAGFKIRDMK